MEEIEEHLDAGKLERFRFMDSFGFCNDFLPVPFDYEGAWRFCVPEKSDGLDFGAVEVAPFYLRLLEANGVKVVRENDWRTADYLAYPNYIMLGLPDDSIERSKTHRPAGYSVRGKPIPSLIWNRQCPVPLASETAFPRLAGALGPNWPVGDVEGMSGGPIFGANGPGRLTVVAVQSAWVPANRITLGCPVSVFAPMIEERIAARRAV
jgi:hypothetical protein